MLQLNHGKRTAQRTARPISKTSAVAKSNRFSADSEKSEEDIVTPSNML
jgi:hypothetical protein